MNIDKKVLNRYNWYEDKDGNVYEFVDRVPSREEVKGMYYHTLFPLEVTEHINFVEDDDSLKHICDITSHVGGGNEEVILAMANSGDYTLGEAIMLWSQCCERCMNVLAYKYLNGADGYAEYSDEWKRCGTVCKFCEGE